MTRYNGTQTVDPGLYFNARRLSFRSMEETGSLLMESSVERFCVAGDVGYPEGRSAIVTGVHLGPSGGEVDILYNNAARFFRME